jgi:hypothetical protein
VSENPIGSRLNAFNAGVPFIGSYNDELLGMLGGPEMKERARAGQEAFSRARPGQDMALRLAGGVTGSLAAAPALPGMIANAPASLLGRAAYGAALGGGAGAAEGAIYGAGQGEAGTRGDTAATGALWGGGTGAVLGGAAPIASDAVSWVARALSERLGPSRAATRAVGLTPTARDVVLGAMQGDDALAGAGRARITAAGPGAMLADAGPSAQDLLDTAIQKSGAGARIAREAVEGRAGAAGQTVKDAMDALAPNPQVATRGTPLFELYERAYTSPIDYSSDAGRKIEGLLPRIPQGIIERANRLIQMDPDAINPRQIMAQVGEGGTARFLEMPNVLQLDYITRAMQDVARAGDGAGALGGNTNEGRIYGKLARLIRTQMREAVPAYGEAVNQAATEIGARNAREFGATAMTRAVTRADLADEISSMGAAEVGHLRLGLRGAVEETLANVRRTVTDGNVDARQAVQAVKDFSSEAARDKLRLVFGEQAADQFIGQLDEAARALELRAGVATNSRTFGRTEADRVIREQMSGGPVEALMHGEPLGATRRVVQALTGRTPAREAAREQGVYAEIARLLTEPRGPQAVQAMELLEQLSARPAFTQAAASRAGRATAGAIALPAYHLAQPRP